MDPLEKRYDDQLEPQVQPQTDGGDLNTGGQTRGNSLWQDNALAGDLNRSLERVQQQEAWLQSQAQPQSLDGNNPSTELGRSNRQSSAQEQGADTLLVVDTGLANWQQQLTGLGQQHDLLLVAPDQAGIQLLHDALAGRSYERVQLLLDTTPSGVGTSWYLGRDALSGNLQQALALEPNVAVDLVEAPAIATTVVASADGLLGLARQSLQIAQEQGRLEAAVAGSFSEVNQAAVLAAAVAFLQGSQTPALQWARFERSNIRGAYLSGSNTILLSEQLQEAPEPIVQAVLLEELGHWLEQGAAQLTDSAGDEGEGFADRLLGANPTQLAHAQTNQDQVWLELNGERVAAELASITNAGTNLNGTSITIQFDEAMRFAGSSDPNNALLERFTLIKNGVQTAGLSAFSGYQFSSPISQSLNLYLNLAYTISPGDTVSLGYSDYSMTNDSFGVLENTSTADLASGVAIVTNMATSSGSGGSGTPYVVSSSAAYESGYQRLNISFSEPLSVTGANTSIAPSLFTLTLSSGAATGVSVSAVSIDSSTVRLGLSAPLPTGTYRISYTPPTLQSAGRLEDMDGNDAGIFSLDVYNSSASSPASPPQLLSIQGTTFDANTNSIKLRFDQDLNQTGITLSTLLARFSLSVGDLTSNPTQVSNAFNSVGFEGSRTIRLTLNNSAVSNYISSQQPFNITYSDPALNSDDSGNVLEVPSGLDVATFTTSTALSSSSPSGSNNPPTLTGITTIMGASEDTFKEITYADLAAAANEGDLDGDALSFRIDAISSGTLEKWSGSAWVGVTAGSTLLTTGEKLQWKAGANATGTLNAFTVSAYDGALASAVPVPVRVSVTAENDAPVRTSAAPSAISVAEDSNNTTPISLGLSSLVYGTGGGSDETSQSLSYTITGIPAFIDVFKSDGTTQITVNDSLTLGELQGLKFKTLANANGTGSLTWTVRDSGGSSNNGFDLLAQSLTITVGAQNDAPIATGSAALPPVQEDASAISGSSIANLFLANFSDAADTVSSGSSANSLAGIVVTANNSTTAQGKWQWKTSGMSTWTDISLSLSNSSALYLASATSLRFLPAPNFNGTPGGLTTRLVDSSAALNNGSIVNALSNGGSTALSASTVTLSTSIIALNDAPVAFGAVSLAAVLEDATAPNGDTVSNLFSGHFSDTADAVGGSSYANGLAGIVVSGNTATAAQGKWQWQAAGASSWTDIAATGLSDATGLFLASTTSLRFLPAANFNGTPGALSARLVDSSATGLSNGGSINVSTNGGTTSYSGTTVSLSTSIGAINDAPLRTSAAPTPISVLEDSTNTVASPLGLSSLTYGGGGQDETSQIFTATITGIPAFINIFKADGVTQVSVNDTLAVNELQGLKFKTIANANGAGNLTWTIRDSGGTTNNGSDSSSDSLAITVATVDDAPYRSGQSPTLPSGYESTPYLIRAQDLLIGFSDSDITDQLSITNLTATNGTLADNNNGTWSFTPVVSNAINLGQIPEDTPKTLNVDDLLGGSRTAIQVQLYYDVVDSTGAAVSSSSGFELARTSSVSAVTVSNLNVTSGSGSLTANANNTWTFTPTPNWFGPVLFSYGISTGGATLAYTGSLNVQPLNDAPLLNSDSRFLAEDNRTQGFSSLLGNDSDVEASQLSLVMVRDATDPSNVASVNQAANSPATLLSNGYGTLEVQANGQYSFTANGSLSQALALGQQAQTAFVYQASDGALVSSSTVTFTIIGANDLPTVEADTRAIAEDAVLVVPASQGVLANDVDRDSGTQLRVNKLSTAGQPAVELGLSGYALLNNEYGTLLMRADGSYSFVADGHASQTLAAGQTANTSFSYQVDDGQSDLGIGGINTSSLSFTITGTNDAPLINGQLNLGMIAEDGSITITAAQLLAMASDIDTPSQNLSVLSVSVDPSHGQITAAGSAWIFAPAVDWNGSADIRFVVSDGSSQSLPKSLSNGVTIRGDRLYLLTTGNSWQGSQQQAQQLGGQLSAIASSAEQSFLEQWLPDNTAAWIGLNDSTTEGLWQWSDGSPITFLRWANAEPNDDSWMANGLGADFAQLLPYSGAGTDPYPRRNWADFSGNLNATAGITEAPFLRRGSSAYVLVDAPSWDQGEANAIRLGGHLATINDAAENAWLLSSFGNNSFNAYIGLNDLAVEGVWQWSSGETSSYRNWAPNEPNNAGDTTSSDYVLMHLWSYSRSGTWNDGENYGVGKGIAEINLAGVASLTVTSVADAPLPIADTAYNVEDQLLSVNASAGLLANDRDPDGSTLQVVGVAEGSAASSFTPLSNGSVSLSNGYGTLTVLADGSYTFQANGALSQEIPVGSSATVSFSYQVSDGSLQSSSTLTIAISGDNDAPQVLGDQRSIGEDQTINIPASGGVLANDSDVDQNAQLTVVGIKANGSSGQPLALLNGQRVISTSYGDLTMRADGSYSFVATGSTSQPLAPGQTVQLVFNVSVSDAIATAQTSSLTLTLIGTNDAPVLAVPITLPDGVDGQPYTFTTGQLLQGWSDVDTGDGLEVVESTLFSNAGRLENLGNGSWRFIRSAENRIDLGTLPEDGSRNLNLAQLLGGSLGAIGITLNYDVRDRFGGQVPAVPPATFNLQRGSAISNASVTNLRVQPADAGVLTGNQNSGWAFTPRQEFNGAVQLLYTVVTANGSSDYVADLRVTSVNDAPVMVIPSTLSTTEDRSLLLAGFSVADVDADELTLTLEVGMGYLTLANGTGLAASSGDGSPTSPLQLRGPVTALNAALAGITYQPTTNAIGSDTLLITTIDASTTGSGGPALISRSIPISITAVNDPPERLTGTLANLIINEDEAATSLGLEQLSYGPGGGSDEAAQQLTYTVNCVPNPLRIGAVLRSDSSSVQIGDVLTIAELQGLRFQPNPNASGLGSFSFSVSDGVGGSLSETIVIQVREQNDAPVRLGEIPEELVVSEASGLTSLGLANLRYAAAEALSLPTSALVAMDQGNGTQLIGLLEPGSGHFTAIGEAAYQSMLGDEVVAERTTGAELLVRQANTILRINLSTGEQRTLLNSAPMLLCYQPGATTEADSLLVYDNSTGTIQAINLTTGSATTLANGVLPNASIQAEGFAAFNPQTNQITLLSRDGAGVLLTTVNLSYTLNTSAIRNDSAYVIVDGPTWEAAETNAINLGGYLATVNDAQESAWMGNEFSQTKYQYLEDNSPWAPNEWSINHYWTGGKRVNGQWEWSSSENFDPSLYSLYLNNNQDSQSNRLLGIFNNPNHSANIYLDDSRDSYPSAPSLPYKGIAEIKQTTRVRPNLPYLQAISSGGSDNGLYGLWEDNDQQGVLVIGRVNPADGTHQSLARLSTGNPSGGFTNGNFTVNAEGIAFVHYSGLFGGQVGSWIAAVDTNTGSVLGASENPGDLIRGTAWLAHETNQQLSVRITALPNANLGAVVLADGSTAVVQGNVYSLAELQSMQFRSSREGQGTGSFSFVVEDNGSTSGVAASLGISETISIRVLPVNDDPSSSGRTLDPFLILDYNNLSLNATSGLYEPVALNIGALLNGATVSYTPGGGVDEAQQPLTYRITELPRATNTLVQPYITSTTELVSYARLTTSFAAGDQLQAVVNGATVTYTVTSADINATDEASTQTTIARNLVATINANNAVNSVVRADVSAGDSRRISLTASNAGVTLGLTSTTSLGDVLLNNAVQTVGAVLSRAQLDQLQFRASLDVADFSASGRLGQFSFVVGDTAAAGSGPDAVLKQSLTILVDTDQAGASNTTRISSNSNRQAIAAAQRAASSLDPLNPNLRFTEASLTYNGQPVQVYATSSINSELSSTNPLYLADMGGSGRLDSEAINYSASTTPFIFDIPVSSNQRGEKIVHSFQYEASLSGQLRSNVSNPNYTSNSVAGFSLETDGSWSFDPMHAAYSSMAVGEFRQVNIIYTETTSGITRGLTLELSKVEALTGETLIIVTPIGPGEMFTTYSRDQWIASNPEGRDQDRYFKYISEYTLETYGAIDTGELTDGGDKIYAWTGDIKTFDREPLTLLDGTIITSAGYYDFTRRNGIGDGVEFLYQTAIEKGVTVDYITGMRFYLTNNMYGDNDPADGNVRDPGAPINIMTELGTITTYSAYASYENVNNGDSTDSSLTMIIPTLSTPNGQGNFDGGSGFALGNAAGPKISAMALNNATAVLVGSAAGTGAAQGQIALSLQGGDEGKQADTGDQDSQGASKLAQGAGANAKPKPGDPGDQRGPTERGLKLDPIQQLASAATAEPSTLLEQLSDTNILGTNLLDALALGAGVLYLLYGPKAIEASKGGFSSWLAGGFGRRSAAAATAGGERSVLALFLMRQPNGQQQLVAARVGQGNLKLLAQQELAPQQAGAQLSDALAAVLEQLPRERCELLLLDPRLQRAAVAATAQLEQLGERRQELASDALASPLAACSDNELAQLRAWLNKPSGTLPQDLPLFQLLQQRQQSYAANLPEQQATMASLIELSLALAWSERP